jgi:2-polyprenyl-3-methyl-5-hydroxy-6-metoxy-1,4-benzoquinol methylase
MNNIMKPTTYDPTRYTTVADFGLSHCIYPKWALVRVAKLISIFGAEWFNGKTVLELACGLGLVGQELQKYGAKVTFTEGRSEYLNEIIQHANGSEVYQIDQDEPWDFGRKFDLVLHWGVLYHLQGWNRDLKTALNHFKDTMM